MSLDSETITLNSNREMPIVGLGVYKATKENEVENAISHAFACGYRLIDTASAYKNEDGVGRGIKASSIPREELFIITKVWNTAQRMGDVEGAFHRSLERLQLDYVDLYLIHWPVTGCYINTWKALENFYSSGLAKSVGVSNFSIQNLEALKEVSDIVPAVNQIECHPLFYQKDLISYCKNNGICVQAYAPLARGAYLNRDVLIQIGEKYGKNSAQVGLRWAIQQGTSIIPKSVHADRIKENIDIFDFTLTEIEMKAITELDEQYRSSGVPEDMK